MQPRWGRILGALGGTGVAVATLPFVPLWLTMPDVQAVARAWPAAEPLACESGAVITASARAHPPHASGEAPEADAAALAAMRHAGRCDTLTPLATPELFDTLDVAHHALYGLDPVERPADAVDGALAVWELAVQQQRAGSMLHAAAWSVIARNAGRVVDDALAQPDAFDAAALAALHARITRIAATPLDWRPLQIREERDMWTRAGLAGHLEELVPLPWRPVADARKGTGDIADLARELEREGRVRTAVLADAVALERDRQAHGAAR